LHGLLCRICGGKDPTAVPGIADYSLLQIIAEVGTDLSRWPTEKHFTAWLGLAPGSHQSGKRRRRVVTRTRNRAGRLFGLLARTIGRSVDKALGGFYRRLKGRQGGLAANKALARKLAELFWRVMVHGLEYVEQGLKKYEAKILQNERRLLEKLAHKLGITLQAQTI
jgi:transposase